MVKCSKVSCAATAKFVCFCHGEQNSFCASDLLTHLTDTSRKHDPRPISAIFDEEVTRLVLSSLNSIKADILQKINQIIENLSRTITLLKHRGRLVLNDMREYEKFIDKIIIDIQLNPEELASNNLTRTLKMSVDLAREECMSWKLIKLNLDSEELRNNIVKLV